MSMYVLFNRNTLTPIQFSYDEALLYEAVNILEAYFEGFYDVLDTELYTDTLMQQPEPLKGVHNE